MTLLALLLAPLLIVGALANKKRKLQEFHKEIDDAKNKRYNTTEYTTALWGDSGDDVLIDHKKGRYRAEVVGALGATNEDGVLLTDSRVFHENLGDCAKYDIEVYVEATEKENEKVAADFQKKVQHALSDVAIPRALKDQILNFTTENSGAHAAQQVQQETFGLTQMWLTFLEKHGMTKEDCKKHTKIHKAFWEVGPGKAWTNNGSAP